MLLLIAVENVKFIDFSKVTTDQKLLLIGLLNCGCVIMPEYCQSWLTDYICNESLTGRHKGLILMAKWFNSKTVSCCLCYRQDLM